MSGRKATPSPRGISKASANEVAGAELGRVTAVIRVGVPTPDRSDTMNPLRQATAGAVSAALFLGASLSPGKPLPSPTEVASPDDEVLVESSKNAFAIDSEVLRSTMAVFDSHRSLAPEAPLVLWAIDRAPRSAPLRLWIERGDVVEPLALGDDRLFSLPASALADGARLRANRTKYGLYVGVRILSPGTTLRLRRMGDLRLQCRVGFALHPDEIARYLPRRKRPIYAEEGGACDSADIPYFPATERVPVRTAEIRGVGVRRSIKVDTTGPNAWAYRAPLHDRSIGDDALIELTFK